MNNEKLAEELVKLAEEVMYISKIKYNKTARITQEIRDMCASFIDQIVKLVEDKCNAKAEKFYEKENVRTDASAQEVYDYMIKQIKSII